MSVCMIDLGRFQGVRKGLVEKEKKVVMMSGALEGVLEFAAFLETGWWWGFYVDEE